MLVKASRKSNFQTGAQAWRDTGRSAIQRDPEQQHVISARERCVRVSAELRNGRPITGSGVIIQTNLVLTNWHVVEDQMTERVCINDHPAELVHFDIRYDMAAYAVKTRKLRTVQFKERGVMLADKVFYVGNPEDVNKSYSQGEVTKVQKDPNRIIASTVPAEGFSGSGLYDLETGSFIGLIDSMIGSRGALNFTVAVPARLVVPFVKDALYRMHKLNIQPPSEETARCAQPEPAEKPLLDKSEESKFYIRKLF